jgi:uncharacterized protein
MPTQLAYPPRLTDFTRPFWSALGEGRFTTTQCTECKHVTFPPKPLCPECWSPRVEWRELSGRGTLRSYTEVCVAPAVFAAEAPYVLCLVDLDEGVRCLSRVLANWEDLRPDARVKVTMRDSEPVSLFEFVMDEDGDSTP